MTPSLSLPPFVVDLRSSAQVLVVDDAPEVRSLLVRLLAADGLTATEASDGLMALQMVEAGPPDLVISDVDMPHLDGISLCRHFKELPATRLLPIILITGVLDQANRIAGIEAGADDFLNKPIEAQELKARVRSLLRLKRYTDELDSAESVILSLALTVEARDPYTQGHCQRLAAYAVRLGEQIGASPQQLSALYRGGYLHDVGKVGMPDEVLRKEGALSPAEYEVMKGHTVIGDRLCGNMRALALVRPIIRHHHERLDGSGYPDGLRGDAIPLLAQIVSVVDTYDAMTTTRSYRHACSPERAFDELLLDAHRGLLNRDLVDAFIAMGIDALGAIATGASAAGNELRT